MSLKVFRILEGGTPLLSDEEYEELDRLATLDFNGKATEEETRRYREIIEKEVRLAAEVRLTPAEQEEFWRSRGKTEDWSDFTVLERKRYLALCDKALHPPREPDRLDRAGRVVSGLLLAAMAFCILTLACLMANAYRDGWLGKRAKSRISAIVPQDVHIPNCYVSTMDLCRRQSEWFCRPGFLTVVLPLPLPAFATCHVWGDGASWRDISVFYVYGDRVEAYDEYAFGACQPRLDRYGLCTADGEYVLVDVDPAYVEDGYFESSGQKLVGAWCPEGDGWESCPPKE